MVVVVIVVVVVLLARLVLGKIGSVVVPFLKYQSVPIRTVSTI